MKNKSSLTLLELLIMIMVFALAAALCLRTFVYSGKLSEADRVRAEAESAAQNMAELLKSEKGDVSAVYKKLNESPFAEGMVVSSVGDAGSSVGMLDANWNSRTAPGGTLNMQVRVERSGFLGTAVITVFDANWSEVYTLSTAWQEDGL